MRFQGANNLSSCSRIQIISFRFGESFSKVSNWALNFVVVFDFLPNQTRNFDEFVIPISCVSFFAAMTHSSSQLKGGVEKGSNVTCFITHSTLKSPISLSRQTWSSFVVKEGKRGKWKNFSHFLQNPHFSCNKRRFNDETHSKTRELFAHSTSAAACSFWLFDDQDLQQKWKFKLWENSPAQQC